MNDVKFKKIMSDEINARLKSDAWNLQVAYKVTAGKKRSGRRTVYLSSFAAGAVAAALTIIFLFGINTGRHAAGYEDFITQQIEGTMRNAAGLKEKPSQTTAAIQEVVLENNTDSMIDETLAMR